MCFLPPISLTGGSTCLHSSSANGHLGWNLQPGGGAKRFGGNPGRLLTVVRSALMLGKERTSPMAYGCAGLTYTSITEPYSTTLPAYMITTESQVCAMTDRSWVISIIDRFSRCLSSVMALRIWA